MRGLGTAMTGSLTRPAGGSERAVGDTMHDGTPLPEQSETTTTYFE